MSASIPRFINPIQMAKMGTCISGVILVKDCTRLEEVVYDTSGEIRVELKFGVDVQQYKYMHGQVDTTLQLICQRCLKPMNITINSTFNFSPVRNEEMAQLLPKNYEPLVLTEKEISVTELIEDEILLSLPVVAMHDEEECEVSLNAFNKKMQQGEVPEVESDKNNVFRKLKILKDSKH